MCSWHEPCPNPDGRNVLSGAEWASQRSVASGPCRRGGAQLAAASPGNGRVRFLQASARSAARDVSSD
ncbi:hypothetical protein COCON_G00183150 [Conger conger]|uniref:Uncharacterized protein n=1 Tax=Conger conger TaxID=82655 RepID=A0A9Q1HT65_CONCO|nr:hypothetical protein COCON_G00183150 [Conger conger]